MSDEPSNSVTAFRKALQDQFQADLGIEFRPGLLDGPLQLDTTLGSCFVESLSEVAGRIQEEELRAVVRVFRAWEQQLDPTFPFDPEPLEVLVDQLQRSIRGHQVGMGDAWMQRIVSAEIDPLRQAVELIVVARGLNVGLSSCPSPSGI